MNAEFEAIFVRLRRILQQHAGSLSVNDDTPTCYCLDARAGPATLQAWRGKMKKAMIPVAWVQIRKACVSYHLMGVYGNTKLCDGMSKELKARMKGHTCFRFKSNDETLFKELEKLTAQGIAGFRKAGYIS